MSPYFHDVLKANPSQHPIIVMPRDVTFHELQNIIAFYLIIIQCLFQIGIINKYYCIYICHFYHNIKKNSNTYHKKWGEDSGRVHSEQ